MCISKLLEFFCFTFPREVPDNTTSGAGIILKSIVPDVRQFAIKGGEDTPRTPSCHIKHVVDIITCSKYSKYVSICGFQDFAWQWIKGVRLWGLWGLPTCGAAS